MPFQMRPDQAARSSGLDDDKEQLTWREIAVQHAVISGHYSSFAETRDEPDPHFILETDETEDIEQPAGESFESFVERLSERVNISVTRLVDFVLREHISNHPEMFADVRGQPCKRGQSAKRTGCIAKKKGSPAPGGRTSPRGKLEDISDVASKAWQTKDQQAIDKVKEKLQQSGRGSGVGVAGLRGIAKELGINRTLTKQELIDSILAKFGTQVLETQARNAVVSEAPATATTPAERKQAEATIKPAEFVPQSAEEKLIQDAVKSIHGDWGNRDQFEKWTNDEIARKAREKQKAAHAYKIKPGTLKYMEQQKRREDALQAEKASGVPFLSRFVDGLIDMRGGDDRTSMEWAKANIGKDPNASKILSQLRARTLDRVNKALWTGGTEIEDAKRALEAPGVQLFGNFGLRELQDMIGAGGLSKWTPEDRPEWKAQDRKTAEAKQVKDALQTGAIPVSSQRAAQDAAARKREVERQREALRVQMRAQGKSEAEIDKATSKIADPPAKSVHAGADVTANKRRVQRWNQSLKEPAKDRLLQVRNFDKAQYQGGQGQGRTFVGRVLSGVLQNQGRSLNDNREATLKDILAGKVKKDVIDNALAHAHDQGYGTVTPHEFHKLARAAYETGDVTSFADSPTRAESLQAAMAQRLARLPDPERYLTLFALAMEETGSDPQHAFSIADRLYARPRNRMKVPSGQASREAQRPQKFCQSGQNKGKPGICPEFQKSSRWFQSRRDDKHASPATTKPEHHGSVRKALAKVTGAITGPLSAGTKKAVKSLPESFRKKAFTILRFGKAAEHKAMTGFRKAQEAAQSEAKAWGLSDEAAAKVAKVLGYIDLASAWTVNMPVTHAIAAPLGPAGSLVAAKVSSWVPMASLGFVAASKATRGTLGALKMLAAANHRVANVATAHAENDPDGALKEWLQSAKDTDWALALFSSAFDRTHDVGKAVALAKKAMGQTPEMFAESTVHRRSFLPVRRAAERFSESGAARIPGVEIFRSGFHRGKPYSEDDIRDMTRNFNKYSVDGAKPGVQVPAVLGHEESQEWLGRSDLPAAGWAKRVGYERQVCPICKGAGTLAEDGEGEVCPDCHGKGTVLVLKADFGDVPKSVKRLVNGRQYKTVSSEVYDKIPDGLPDAGKPSKMLRRVAFLGGEIPQIKSLEDIPITEDHGEHSASFDRVDLRCSGGVCCDTQGSYVVFYEARPRRRSV